MYRALRSTGSSIIEYRVFREMAEARVWLGLPPREAAVAT